MAAWTPGLSALIAIGKGVKGTTHSGISDNITALAEGASGAPSIEEAALAASIVSQGKLKTATSEVTHASSTLTTYVFTGGQYGFYPQIKMSGTTVANYDAHILDLNSGAGFTTYASKITLAAGSGTIYAQQRYVQASPPYDLGDGEVPLFIFALIDDITGSVIGVSLAADPPWANNGPTDIRTTHHAKDGTPMQRRRIRPPAPIEQMTPVQADAWLAQVKVNPFEEVVVDQALKQADMPLIPHPFQGNDLTGKRIVLIDPVSIMCEKLALMYKAGEDVNGLLHKGHIVIDNGEVARATPPGVLAHPVKWKNTP